MNVPRPAFAILVGLFSISPLRAQYNISLVAGNGRTYSGDNGPATSAGMAPVSVSVANAGNVYIADSAYTVTPARIRKVDATGTITTIAGGGTKYETDGAVATDVSLPSQIALTVDTAGNVYFVDSGGTGTIWQVDTSGFLDALGNHGLPGPTGIVLDGAGNFWVSGGHQVVKVSPKGVVTIVAGTGSAGYSGDGGPAISAQLKYPHGIAVDGAGNLFIADTGNTRIRKVDTSGIITTVAGNGTSTDNGSGDGRPAINATFNTIQGVAVDSAGNLYITDACDVIRKVNASGIITTIAGTGFPGGESGDGGPALKAQINDPTSLVVDTSGRVYFIDNGNNRVRVLTPIQTTPPPTATITSLLPSSATAGGPGFVLTVNGTGFLSGAVVRWSGSALATTFVSTTQLTAQVPASLIAAAGSVGITVVNPGAAASNSVSFNVGAVSSCTPAGLLLQTINPSSGFAVQSGQPLNIGAALVNNCGAVTSAAVTATFSNGDAAIQLTNIGQGNFAGTWSPHAAGGVVIQISAIESLGTGQLLSAGTAISGTIFSAQTQRLVTSVSSLTFSVAQGGSPTSQSISIQNQGSGPVSLTVAATGGPWLSADPMTATASNTAPANITVTVNPSSLAAGTYSGAIVISGGAQALPPVSVNVTVSAAQPILLLSQTALSFTAAEGGGAPLPQDFGILNIGQGTMSWTAAASSGGGWLSLSSIRGTVNNPYLDVSSVNALVNPANLMAGTYYGQIKVTAPGFDNLLQTISVVLTVLPRGTSPGPEVRPSGLIFAGPQNASPGAQMVMISNPNPKPTLFNSAAITLPGVGTWFANTPANTTIAPGQPAQMSIQPDFSHLSPGASRGAITLLFDDGTTRNIELLAVIPPTSSASGALKPEANGCTAAQLNILVAGPQQVLSVSIGQPVTLDVRVVDGCGQPMTSGGVEASFSNGDPPLAMVHVGNGRWTATWQPQKPVPASTAAAVQLNAFEAVGVKLLANQLDIPVIFGAPSGVPIVSSGGILNAASFAGSNPVAPGSLITIFGANLSSGNPGPSATVPLPVQLGGTQVTLAGRALPLLYTSGGQINAQAPFDLPVNVPSQLVVQTGNALSVPETVLLAPAQPAVFTQAESGQGQGVIVNGVTNRLADSSAPVTAGDTVVIYCTGLGAVNPPVALGAAPSGPTPTVQTVTVTIGGMPAAVAYAGLTPGFPGLYQVNAVVPQGIASGGQVPVVLSTAGQTSPTVTIAVR